MQCGLSWDTVLKKREIFRSCFDGFNYEKIATYTAKDIERIMNTAGVIRSQRKIEAVINNARIFQKIRNEFGSFSQYIWSWSGGKALLYRGHELGNLPASNELSDKISADLKKRGMKFLGSVTVYAHLQASGIINDHIKDCYCNKRLLEQYPTQYIETKITIKRRIFVLGYHCSTTQRPIRIDYRSFAFIEELSIDDV